MKTRFAFLVVSIFCAYAFFAACSKPADPRATPLAVATPDEFAAWKTSAAKTIPPAEMQEFDTCVNEIRMGILQRREASGTGPVAQKLCDYINGKTMREVLIMGHGATVDWVTKELVLQRNNRDKTEEALSGPGSDEGKAKLRDYLVQVKDNIAKLEARREKAAARLAELEK